MKKDIEAVRTFRTARVWGALIVSLLALPVSRLEAQSAGSVSGVVRDPAGRALAGARVHVVGGNGTVNSAADGGFRLSDVPAGTQRVVVQYLGYAADTVAVEVVAGRVARADVTLKTPVFQLSALLVEGRVAGQAAALNQQRAADNLTSVVDAELVGRLPDQNLAEALARVPGVALVRDQGEGRYIQIRGADANLTTLSINGMRVPSPDSHGRYTPMDGFAADMIASIRVNKTLTPDMDADAVGGNVEIVTRTARAGQPLLSLNVAGGQNRINNGGIGNFAGYAGKRFGVEQKLGLVLGGSYYSNERGSQNYEMGWCIEATCNGVPTERRLDVPTSIALRDYSQVKRTRDGVNGTLDYRFNENSTLFLKGFYSKFSDDEQRYVTLANFGSGRYVVADENHGTVTGGRMDKEIRLRPVSQAQRSFQLGGRHLVSGAALDYTVQVARALEDRPQTLTMLFRQSSMDFTYDVSDPDWPEFTLTKGDPLDATRYTYNSLREQIRHLVDDEKSGRVNLSVPLRLGSAAASLKFGAAARMKDRTLEDLSNRFLNSFKAGMPAPTLPLTVSSLIGKVETPDFLDGKYTFGPKVSADAVHSFWSTYRASINQDVPRSTVESTQGYYAIGEDVYAGYLMGTLDVGAVRIIPGARFEHTEIENTGNLVKQVGTNVTVTPHTTPGSYSNVFPSITTRWALDNQTSLRAAVTTSLVRPDYELMAPRVAIPDGTNVTAAIGNPELKPMHAVSYDLIAERYLSSVGFVSLGVFHKELRDFIFTELRPVATADGFGPEVVSVTEPINGQTGKLTGIEAAWQQNLTFLPGILSRLGVNANYTWTTSSATFESREGTTPRLPGQAGNTANFGLFYEDTRLSIRGGYQFSDRFLELLGVTSSTDVYVAARGQLDVSGSLRLMDHAKLFAEVNNLTNQPLRRYIGKEERGQAPGDEYYRTWGMIGLRVQY